MLRKIHILAIVGFAVVMIAGLFTTVSYAGEGRIPLRVQKVKEGDWIFYIEDGEYFKETAKELEKLDDDYIVHYVQEKYDRSGKVIDSEEVARFLSDERREMAELAAEKGVKIQKRRAKIDGKNAEIYAAMYSDPVPYEIWYSPDVGITGRVAMVMKLPSEDDPDKMVEERDLDTLGFGNAKTQFNFRKYVK